jgi:hypothetical protein
MNCESGYVFIKKQLLARADAKLEEEERRRLISTARIKSSRPRSSISTPSTANARRGCIEHEQDYKDPSDLHHQPPEVEPELAAVQAGSQTGFPKLKTKGPR